MTNLPQPPAIRPVRGAPGRPDLPRRRYFGEFRVLLRSTEPGPPGRDERGAGTLSLPDEASRRIGGYELLGELGRGGLSAVHLAAPVGTRRRVALKRVELAHPGEAAASAFLDAAAAGTPLHAAVLRPLTTFVHDGEPWLVLRLMAGGSLRRHAGALSSAQAARALIPVLDALDHAGRRRIAHGDVKPENILLGPRGAVMVADFGLVAAHERARGCAARGTWIATPGYAAPERALGDEATPAADLFALGAVARELMGAARHDLDPDLVAWVDGLMAPAPRDRPPGAAAARARLEEIMAAGHGPRWREAAGLPAAPPLAAAPEGAPRPALGRALAEMTPPVASLAPPADPPRPSRRRAAPALIALGLVVAAGVAGVVARAR